MGRIVLIGGGARSGKSRFASNYAIHLGPRRLFVATAAGDDDEMRLRISRHRQERGDAFVTREEQTELVPGLGNAADFDVVVIDCLTLWLSNLLLQGRSDSEIKIEVDRLVAAMQGCVPHVLAVSNEVGLGIVPEHALGRRFRDSLGRVHQTITPAADELYLGAMGTMIRLKPSPVETMDSESWL